MKMNGPERSKLRQGRSTWEWVKHARLYYDLLLALRERVCQLWFSTERTLISASAVPHCGEANQTNENIKKI